VCVCVGVALNTFFFLVSSFILSPTGKTLAGRLPTGYITLLKRRETLWDSHGTVISSRHTTVWNCEEELAERKVNHARWLMSWRTLPSQKHTHTQTHTQTGRCVVIESGTETSPIRSTGRLRSNWQRRLFLTRALVDWLVKLRSLSSPNVK
jgi:hypothetical protein